MKCNVLNVEKKTDSTSPLSTKTLDPDLASYFLVHRQTRDSTAVSPSYQEFKDNASRKSAKSNKTTKSKHARTPANSISSALLASRKRRNIAEWNDKSVGASTKLWTPSLFESQRHPADPPRPPRPGLEWVWFPDGYWAEREVRDVPLKKTRPRWWNISPEMSAEKSKRDSATSRLTADNVPQRTDIPEIKIGSSSHSIFVTAGKPSRKSSRKSSKVESLLSIKLGGFNFLRPDTETDISSQPETLGSKNRVESGMDSVDMVGWGSRTTTVLEGAASYFNNQRVGLGSKSCASTPVLPSSPEYRTRRPFGLAPWHRKSSNGSFLSVSSSVHQILMGRTPVASPHPDRKYAGHEGRTYPNVEISSPDPNEPNFLPSEAKRINTPPMSPGTPGGARGFFFDLKAAKDEAEAASPATSNGSGSATGKPKSPRGWWNTDSKHITGGNKTPIQSEKYPALARALSPSAFELSLPPEHLPSSPLCPKNPMHSSGGKGICPFHGRRKSVALKVIKRVNTGNMSSSGTTIR
ncbi:uncharacterized protein PAC_12278 [Phialocephala subalpina]|uniref:Uncharacterized protein n=1 Tax=Phialocephala subalpina TaxID=576137 RepID=A0A1L7XBI3_9HELO|nr:uncharacterized protein PAC_12278 [Phialocephala subalpina]